MEIYGPNWSPASEQLEKILSENNDSREGFRRVLDLGYFSSYTSWKNSNFQKDVAEQQWKILNEEFGDFWRNFPEDFEESDLIKNENLIKKAHKKITTDFLRQIYYALEIKRHLKNEVPDDPILEIGAGSGGLIRILKTLFPATQFWVLDISSSLRFVEIYLRNSFPKAKFSKINNENDWKDKQEQDFILIPCEYRNSLKNQKFSFAINIFSFGEMPNKFIEDYYALIQEKCETKRIFLLNHIMHPVTTQTIERIDVGNWLFKLNKYWRILKFQINPKIHQIPQIKLFFSSILIVAEKINNQKELESCVETAKNDLKQVFNEDWINVCLAQDPNMVLARLEKENLEINNANPNFQFKSLLDITKNVGLFFINHKNSSPLFELWNFYRIQKSHLIGELLVIYFAMLNKTDLLKSCTKEELQILNNQKTFKINNEYSEFLGTQLAPRN